jgi:hypothetical protein
VDDLAGALADLHGHGLRVAGSEADAPLTARQADLRGPLALVVGSEGQGLGPTVRKRCDLLMRIPMRGAVGSLNAAVAGSILLFEAVAQRDPEGVAWRAAVAPWPGPRTVATHDATPTDDASAAEESDAVDEGRPGEASAVNRETATSVSSPTEAAPAVDTAPAGEDLLPAEPPPAAKPKRTRVAKAPKD